jgi:hypothetical protein
MACSKKGCKGCRKCGGHIPKYPDGGKINPIEGDLYSKVLMERNRDKDFVQRAYNPDPNKVQYNPNGTTSTHKMAWGTDETGQAYMYPTIFNENNEAIKVPNMYADYISSQGYKKATGMDKRKQGGWLDSYGNGGDVKPMKERVLSNEKIETDNYEEYLEALEIYNHALGLDDDGVPNVDGPVQEPKYTGTVKPYVAKNKADFDYRNQMYNDSLDLYNAYKFQSNLFGEGEYIPKEEYLNKNIPGSASGEFAKKIGKSPIKGRRGDNYYRATGEETSGYERKTAQPWDPNMIGGMRAEDFDVINYVNNLNNPNVYPVYRNSPEFYHKDIKPTGYYKETKGYINPQNAIYKKPTQKVYPPSEGYPNTTSGEFNREITRMPKPTPRPAIPEKMESQEAHYKILDNLYTMPTRNFALEKIAKVMDGDMMDKYVRPNVSNVRSNRDYASANFPGKKPRGMSREEYNQYFLEKKNGGWLDEL